MARSSARGQAPPLAHAESNGQALDALKRFYAPVPPRISAKAASLLGIDVPSDEPASPAVDAIPSSLREVASYAPFLLWKRAAHATALTAPEVHPLTAAVLFADISGFTKLTEELANSAASEEQAGLAPLADGADTLTRIINAYFEKMLTVIIRHRGDVLKFAGDAMLVLFPCEQDSLRAASLRAAQCALSLQRECGAHRATDKVSLSLHIGVGLGNLALFLVGGAYGRWECVVEGEVIGQVGGAEGCAEPGEVVLSAQAWRMVEQLRARGEDKPGGDGFVKLLELPPRAPMALQLCCAKLPELPPVSEAMVPTLALFLPGAVKERLLAAVHSKQDAPVESHQLWLSELRRVTTLFINVKLPSALAEAEADFKAGGGGGGGGGGGVPPRLVPQPSSSGLFSEVSHGDDGDGASAPPSAPMQRRLDAMQQILSLVQNALYVYGGSLNKFLADDKGTTIIGAFNLPLPAASVKQNPHFFSEHAARAVAAALDAQVLLPPLSLSLQTPLSSPSL